MVWPAWRCVTWLRDRYAAKRSSELLLTIDAIWLLQALILASRLSREQGAIAALAALLPWIAWRVTLHAAIRPVLKEARERDRRCGCCCCASTASGGVRGGCSICSARAGG